MKKPSIGSRWVWEIEKPHVIAVVEVIEIDGGMVKLRTLLGKKTIYGTQVDQGSETWNELSRFYEACLPVGK